MAACTHTAKEARYAHNYLRLNPSPVTRLEL
jgi:hypothetical protein